MKNMIWAPPTIPGLIGSVSAHSIVTHTGAKKPLRTLWLCAFVLRSSTIATFSKAKAHHTHKEPGIEAINCFV
jgi:hypothetical protein